MPIDIDALARIYGEHFDAPEQVQRPASPFVVDSAIGPVDISEKITNSTFDAAEKARRGEYITEKLTDVMQKVRTATGPLTAETMRQSSMIAQRATHLVNILEKLDYTLVNQISQSNADLIQYLETNNYIRRINSSNNPGSYYYLPETAVIDQMVAKIRQDAESLHQLLGEEYRQQHAGQAPGLLEIQNAVRRLNDVTVTIGGVLSNKRVDEMFERLATPINEYLPEFRDTQNPRNLETVVEQLMSGADSKYRGGGKYQLIKKEGGKSIIQFGNLMMWVREKSWWWSWFNDDADISLYEMLRFETVYRSITFFELLAWDREKYFSSRYEETDKQDFLDFQQFLITQMTPDADTHNNAIAHLLKMRGKESSKQQTDELCDLEKVLGPSGKRATFPFLSPSSRQIEDVKRNYWLEQPGYIGWLGEARRDTFTIYANIVELAQGNLSFKDHDAAVDLYMRKKEQLSGEYQQLWAQIEPQMIGLDGLIYSLGRRIDAATNDIQRQALRDQQAQAKKDKKDLQERLDELLESHRIILIRQENGIEIIDGKEVKIYDRNGKHAKMNTVLNALGHDGRDEFFRSIISDSFAANFEHDPEVGRILKNFGGGSALIYLFSIKRGDVSAADFAEIENARDIILTRLYEKGLTKKELSLWLNSEDLGKFAEIFLEKTSADKYTIVEKGINQRSFNIFEGYSKGKNLRKDIVVNALQRALEKKHGGDCFYDTKAQDPNRRIMVIRWNEPPVDKDTFQNSPDPDGVIGTKIFLDPVTRQQVGAEEPVTKRDSYEMFMTDKEYTTYRKALDPASRDEKRRYHSRQLTFEEIQYAIQFTGLMPYWMLLLETNDTSISGSTSYLCRDMHPDNWRKRQYGVNKAGRLESLGLFENATDIPKGLRVMATEIMPDGSTRPVEVSLMSWIQRGDGAFSRTRTFTDQQIPSGSLRNWGQYAFDGSLDWFDEITNKGGEFDPSQVIRGIELTGRAIISGQSLDELKSFINKIQNLLVKYPYLLKEPVRVWRPKMEDGKIVKGGGAGYFETVLLENYLLGEKVFELQKLLGGRPEVDKMKQNAQLARALEAGIYAAYIRAHTDPKNPQYHISTDRLKEISFVLQQLPLDVQDIEITLPNGQKSTKSVAVGQRFTKKEVEKIFIFAGVDPTILFLKEEGEEIGGLFFVLLIAFIKGAFIEAFKGVK